MTLLSVVDAVRGLYQLDANEIRYIKAGDIVIGVGSNFLIECIDSEGKAVCRITSEQARSGKRL